MKRIGILSRRGHYNFCKPAEESISTQIAIYEDDKKVFYVNITTDDELSQNDNDPIYLVELIQEHLDRLFYTSTEKKLKNMIQFLKDNVDELNKGNKEYKLRCLTEKRDKLSKEIELLEEAKND